MTCTIQNIPNVAFYFSHNALRTTQPSLLRVVFEFYFAASVQSIRGKRLVCQLAVTCSNAQSHSHISRIFIMHPHQAGGSESEYKLMLLCSQPVQTEGWGITRRLCQYLLKPEAAASAGAVLESTAGTNIKNLQSVWFLGHRSCGVKLVRELSSIQTRGWHLQSCFEWFDPERHSEHQQNRNETDRQTNCRNKQRADALGAHHNNSWCWNIKCTKTH